MTIQEAIGRPHQRSMGGGNGNGTAGRAGTAQDGAGRGLANGLGLFSLALGIAELAAPSRVARLIGVRDDEAHRASLRAAGLREITSGIGILTQERPVGWLWSRVGGDMMDLSLLAGALKQPGTRRDRALLATAAVLGVTLLDVLASQKLTGLGVSDFEVTRRERGAGGQSWLKRLPAPARSGVQVKTSITVNRPLDEVYAYWHDFQNLPTFMSHLESVQVTGLGRSHWKTKGPAGSSVEWDAEIIEEVPNRIIAWRSLEGADVANNGRVVFNEAPGSRGTELHVELVYNPPGGAVGKLIAKLFGEAPDQQIRADLRKFKQVMEVGEVVHSDASIHRGPHPARPAGEVSRALKGGAS
jgi:uncharacterized membrane protein